MGVKVIDTGGHGHNTIYGNNFDVLYVGNAAVGIMWDGSKVAVLCTKCNFSTGSNVFDFGCRRRDCGGSAKCGGERSGENTFSQNSGNPEVGRNKLVYQLFLL